MKTLTAVALLASSLCANADILTYVNIKAEDVQVAKYSVSVATLEECKLIVAKFLTAYYADNLKHSSFYGACVNKADKSFSYEIGITR